MAHVIPFSSEITVQENVDPETLGVGQYMVQKNCLRAASGLPTEHVAMTLVCSTTI